MGTRLKAGEVRSRLKTNPSSANPAAAGTNLLVAAPGVGFRITVFGFLLINNVGTAQGVQFQSAANPRSGFYLFPAGGTVPVPPVFLPPSEWPLMECGDNEALNALLTAATSTVVQVWYAIERT